MAQAQRSARTEQKVLTRRTEDGLPVHSFGTFLQDLATVVRNTVRPKQAGTQRADLTVVTQPTALQHRALELLTQVV